MKGIKAAITITLAILCGAVAIMGELSSRGVHFEKDMTPNRLEAQVKLITGASAFGLSNVSQYKLGKDKYENQTSALNIFALIVGFPVLFLAPIVYFQGLTKQNRLLAITSIGVAISAIILPFNLIASVFVFIVQWLCGAVFSQRIKER